MSNNESPETEIRLSSCLDSVPKFRKPELVLMTEGGEGR